MHIKTEADKSALTPKGKIGRLSQEQHVRPIEVVIPALSSVINSRGVLHYDIGNPAQPCISYSCAAILPCNIMEGHRVHSKRGLLDITTYVCQTGHLMTGKLWAQSLPHPALGGEHPP